MAEDFHIADYDFLDFGASTGGSLQFAQKVLGGTRGLGVDIDPKKVQKARDAGFECMQGDMTQLELPDRSVRFVIMSHVLEHLPGLDLVEGSIRSAARVARDFVYIQGPFFDADQDLARQGLKFYWSDWTGHPCHLTTSQLTRIFRKLGLRDTRMFVRGAITHSSNEALHPLDSPLDQHGYDPSVHPPKETFQLRVPVFREIVACVRLSDVPWTEILPDQDERPATSVALTPWIRRRDPLATLAGKAAARVLLAKRARTQNPQAAKTRSS
jgi:hypothetical protein